MRITSLLAAVLLSAAVDSSAGQAPQAANPASVRVAVRDATGQDIRHRLQGSINSNLWAGFRFDASLRAQSAAPYTITTGLDTNRDGEHNERPTSRARKARADPRAAVVAAADRIRGRASGADAVERQIRRAASSLRARPTS